MADQTGIEWTDSTFNGWIGCTKVSPACENCYAAVSTPARTKGIEWGAGKPRQRTSESNWHMPVKWNAKPFFQCDECGWRGDKPASEQCESTNDPICPRCSGLFVLETRRRVFCASLADWLDNEVPIEWLTDLLELIMLTPQLDWLLLTKRIGNWRPRLMEAKWCALRRHRDIGCLDSFSNPSYQLVAFLKGWCAGRAPDNVWIGSTVINQVEADRDIPKLLQVPARIRFLSIEPMLGAVDVSRWLDPTGVECMDVCPDDHYVNQDDYETAGSDNDPICAHCGLVAGWTGFDPGIDWVICGGESGPHARPMYPYWVRSLRDQCSNARVPFLFKQWGEFQPTSHCAEDCTRTPVAVHISGNVEYVSSDAFKHIAFQEVGWAGMCSAGKKTAGRLLDGRTWDQYPETAL